ncbi:MAG: lytic murein transglycosylase, partial [Pseudomonadota bacterium]
DGDGRRDLWESWPDAIGSVASYIADHGWEAGEPLLHRLPGDTDVPLKELADEGVKPSFTVDELRDRGLDLDGLDGDREAAVIRLEQEEGHDHWLAFGNFYAITRYNHSELYAMAIHQLGEAVREEVDG